tara:strand:+ start:87 stop:296 length:210 start_codon:yes stop_codon:yes gene_type:complete
MDDKKFNKILNILKRELSEEGVPPTNNVGGGQIAGTVEAGDDPPVRKKKRYIYQKGLRKTWSPTNGRSS